MDIFGLKINTPWERRTTPTPRFNNQKRTHGMRMMEGFRDFGGFMRGVAATMFGGARNIYEVYGYKTRLRNLDMMIKYTRQDIASRIVNMPSDALWTAPPTVTGDSKIVAVIDDLATRCNLWWQINRVDRLAGMNPYAILLIGVDDNLPIDQPVDPNKNNTITFIQPYGSEAATVSQYQTDPTNPRFGLPLYYNLMISRATEGNFASVLQTPVSMIGTTRIHWTRVVHIAENILEDSVFGNPRLMRCYNLLDDLLKVGGGSAEIFWLSARGGLHFDVDKDMDLDGDDAEELEKEIDDYSNNVRRVIRTRGVKIEPINMNAHDPRAPFEVIMSLISASEGIPQRMLVGSEAGQLASVQDRNNWTVTVKQRRSNFGMPMVLRPLFITFANLGICTMPAALAAIVNWPEAFQLSPLERAQTAAQQARSATNLQKCIPPLSEQTTKEGTDGQIIIVPEVDDYVLSKAEARNIIFMGNTGDTADASANNDL